MTFVLFFRCACMASYASWIEMKVDIVEDSKDAPWGLRRLSIAQLECTCATVAFVI
jgi:hypothetical protein